jgi:tetratricopeptide (TPR) repeat protein
VTTEPWEEKKDRLLYVALAAMSDACDAPELTPTCPFYEIHDGRPVCAEQCRDILAENLPPIALPATLSLGHDLQAIPRPRPRRGPDQDAIAFDARQVFLREQGRPVEIWSVMALLVGLKIQFAHALRPPESPSLATVLEIQEALEHRGIDFDKVLRHGIGPTILAGILRRIDKASADDTDAQAWLHSAPVDDLLEHRLGQSADQLRARVADIPRRRDVDTVWLVERFTETFVDRWQSTSWRQEYRYLHLERKGCCLPGVMRERVVDEQQIAGYLAEIGCRHIDGHEDTSDRPISVAEFTSIALGAISRGNRSEAAAIYRSIGLVRPDDGTVANNLGFCLLPDDPQEARHCFERALALPHPDSPEAMMHLNLALAQYLCGDIDAAAKSLEDARSAPQEACLAHLWDLELAFEGQWATVRVVELTNYADALERFMASGYIDR